MEDSGLGSKKGTSVGERKTSSSYDMSSANDHLIAKSSDSDVLRTALQLELSV